MLAKSIPASFDFLYFAALRRFDLFLFLCLLPISEAPFANLFRVFIIFLYSSENLLSKFLLSSKI